MMLCYVIGQGRLIAIRTRSGVLIMRNRLCRFVGVWFVCCCVCASLDYIWMVVFEWVILSVVGLSMV